MSSSPSTTAGMPPSAGRSTGSSVRMSSSSSQAGSSSISSSHVWSGTLSVRSGPSANAGSRQPHSSTSTMHSAAARSVSRLRSSRFRIQQPSFILAPGGDAALCVIRIPFTGHEGCHCVPAQKNSRIKKNAAGVFRLRQRSAVSEFSVFRCGWWLPCSALRGGNIPSEQCNSRSGGRTPPGWRRRARSSSTRTSGCTLQ